ncbi:hypothetical protein P3X46_008005 [Hevea brasiliensis]|uniref:Uncharacterized protein n=1 Tax=Hevea brasiliensis TaxID=3981 RepID=A0ABQ9MH50_HEVBR|nr:uncharacterized protein LOC110670200 isoform X1 [Hevea brasiliensis]KAJ9179659.1 hypothetical protein P3X46_008005 [Hevea brasiliensis]
MQAGKGKQLPWKININARASKFHFKFKATKIDPTSKFFKFSLFLRLHAFLLQVKTDSTPRQPPTTLKSKFLKFFRKFNTSSAKKRAIAPEKTSILQNPESKVPADPPTRSSNEEPICIGSLFFGSLALLSKSISEKDEKGITIHGLFIMSFLALFFKKYVTGKAKTLPLFLTIVLVICAVKLPFDKYIYYRSKDYVFQVVWKAWNYAASSGCLYVLSQAIFTRF